MATILSIIKCKKNQEYLSYHIAKTAKVLSTVVNDILNLVWTVVWLDVFKELETLDVFAIKYYGITSLDLILKFFLVIDG